MAEVSSKEVRKEVDGENETIDLMEVLVGEGEHMSLSVNVMLGESYVAEVLEIKCANSMAVNDTQEESYVAEVPQEERASPLLHAVNVKSNQNATEQNLIGKKNADDNVLLSGQVTQKVWCSAMLEKSDSFISESRERGQAIEGQGLARPDAFRKERVDNVEVQVKCREIKDCDESRSEGREEASHRQEALPKMKMTTNEKMNVEDVVANHEDEKVSEKLGPKNLHKTNRWEEPEPKRERETEQQEETYCWQKVREIVYVKAQALGRGIPNHAAKFREKQDETIAEEEH